MILFPKAIVHLDADAFFVSCEQALHPSLKGRAVVVGGDRGIVTALSYEAKAKGVKRCMLVSQAKQICPELVVCEGDYEAYSLFSRRLFSIMRRFTDQVEEYSIDEGFMDITGLDKVEGLSYRQIAETIKNTIQRELGITVSVGLAPTKVLAKLASGANKPNGLVVISTKDLPEYLRDFLVDKVWGIGSSTAEYMRRLNIFSAYDFVMQPLGAVRDNFSKPHQEIWQELQGVSIYPVISEEKTTVASISKTHTFTVGRTDREAVYAELVRNLENACAKARQHNLVATRVSIFVKNTGFSVMAMETKLIRPSAFDRDIIAAVKPLFARLYQSGQAYRATGIVLAELVDADAVQGDLFETATVAPALRQVYAAVDTLAKRFGKHTVHSAATLAGAKLNKDNVKKPGRVNTPWHLPLVMAGVVR